MEAMEASSLSTGGERVNRRRQPSLGSEEVPLGDLRQVEGRQEVRRRLAVAKGRHQRHLPTVAGGVPGEARRLLDNMGRRAGGRSTRTARTELGASVAVGLVPSVQAGVNVNSEPGVDQGEGV